MAAAASRPSTAPWRAGRAHIFSMAESALAGAAHRDDERRRGADGNAMWTGSCNDIGASTSALRTSFSAWQQAFTKGHSQPTPCFFDGPVLLRSRCWTSTSLGGQHGGGVLRVLQPAGDGLAQAVIRPLPRAASAGTGARGMRWLQVRGPAAAAFLAGVSCGPHPPLVRAAVVAGWRPGTARPWQLSRRGRVFIGARCFRPAPGEPTWRMPAWFAAQVSRPGVLGQAWRQRTW